MTASASRKRSRAATPRSFTIDDYLEYFADDPDTAAFIRLRRGRARRATLPRPVGRYSMKKPLSC